MIYWWHVIMAAPFYITLFAVGMWAGSVYRRMVENWDQDP